MPFEHLSHYPKNQLEADLQQFELLRSSERFEYGEDFQFGPGYKVCIEDYYCEELGDKIPNNKLLDELADKLDLPRSKIVPAMAGSFEAGLYLSGIVDINNIIRITEELEVAVCATEEDALKLKRLAPIILPKSTTQRARFLLQNTEAIPQVSESKREIELKENFRHVLAEMLDASEEKLSLHLGADEIIKAIYRAAEEKAAEQGRKPTVFIPLPNYFDALKFAENTGHTILSTIDNTDLQNQIKLWLEKIQRHQPDTIYISQPNNPLGTALTEKQLEELIEGLPDQCHLIIDEVNLNLEAGHQLISTPWQELFKKYPHKRITIVDSFSKSHDLVTERIGFALSSHDELTQDIRKYEPPRLAQQGMLRVISAQNRPLERWSLNAANHFHERLSDIASKHSQDIKVVPSVSNFVTITFQSPAAFERFYQAASGISAAEIGVKKILGLPLSGAGELSPQDITTEDVLTPAVLSKKGILGLSNTTIRLSALSHPAILDALEHSFAS